MNAASLGWGFVMVHEVGIGFIAGPPARGTRGEAAVSATRVVRKVVTEASIMLPWVLLSFIGRIQERFDIVIVRMIAGPV